MSSRNIQPDHVVELLLRDAIPTLGERARGEVVRLARNYESLAEEWIHDGDSRADAQRWFERAVVEAVQQTAHEQFWDTTWPACPSHPHHPLWYDDDRRAWCCRQDGVAYAPLGELTRLRPPDEPG